MVITFPFLKVMTMNPDQKDCHLIPTGVVRELIGVSDMSLWRWLKDPKIDFPRPKYIGRRRYWREVEILNWINNRPECPETFSAIEG